MTASTALQKKDALCADRAEPGMAREPTPAT